MITTGGGTGASPFRRFVHVGAAVLLVSACSTTEDGAGTPEGMVSETIEQVLVKRTPELMRMAGVQGVGQGLCNDKPCIRVYVADSAAAGRLPSTLDGYTVSPVVTGTFRATTE